MRTWWITHDKQYDPSTKRWYCRECDRRTPIERNPEWDGRYEGEVPAPEWFVRCAYCKTQHYQSAFYECPNCGWSGNDEWYDGKKPENLIEISNSHSVMSMEYSNCIDWDETWRCAKCRTVFSFTNGNC